MWSNEDYDPYEAAAFSAWEQEQGGCTCEEDILAQDPRNFDTREYNGEDDE